MIKVYGCSDDLVEIEGAPYPYDEGGGFERNVRIWCYLVDKSNQAGGCRPSDVVLP